MKLVSNVLTSPPVGGAASGNQLLERSERHFARPFDSSRDATVEAEFTHNVLRGRRQLRVFFDNFYFSDYKSNKV